MRRRPEQQSMLTLMGASALETKPPFADFKLSRIFRDEDGNIHEVTTVGPGSPAYSDAEDVDPWWDQPTPEVENA